MVTVDDDGDVGSFPSIVMSPNGRLHIAYWDELNGNLKYIE